MEVNEQQQETAETTAGAVSEPIPSGMQNLAELLSAGDEASAREQERDSGESTSEPGGSQETAQLTEFNDLAERLGVDLDSLYKLQVKTSDSGEPVTIEELKDLHKKRDEIELGKIEFEEHRVEQEQL